MSNKMNKDVRCVYIRLMSNKHNWEKPSTEFLQKIRTIPHRFEVIQNGPEC